MLKVSLILANIQNLKLLINVYLEVLHHILLN